MAKIVDGYVESGDVTIHYVEAGPPEGHLVILLHGFPSFWCTWKYQIGPLADAGFHVVAPDLRGYNLSSKPHGVSSYGRAPVLSDVTALLDHCGRAGEKATLVGHDWGGIVAWAYAQDFPARLARLGIINMPHPGAFARAVLGDWKQMRRSWYIFFFQLPYVGELIMSRNNFQALRTITQKDPSRPQSEEHFQKHVEAFSQPGALSASINYYRAGPWHWSFAGRNGSRKVGLPVLVLWGERDYVFEPYLTDPPKEEVPNATVVRFPDASHWLMWDEPEEVTQHLLDFLKADATR